MSLEALANLGERVGGAAVVLSLVYLAFQLRQNTQSLLATAPAAVAATERFQASQGRAEPAGPEAGPTP